MASKLAVEDNFDFLHPWHWNSIFAQIFLKLESHQKAFSTLNFRENFNAFKLFRCAYYMTWNSETESNLRDFEPELLDVSVLIIQNHWNWYIQEFYEVKMELYH